MHGKKTGMTMKRRVKGGRKWGELYEFFSGHFRGQWVASGTEAMSSLGNKGLSIIENFAIECLENLRGDCCKIPIENADASKYTNPSPITSFLVVRPFLSFLPHH